MKIVIYLLVLAFVFAWCMCGLREIVGDLVIRIFPSEPLTVGSKVEIYLNGRHNRTATVNSVQADKFVIYDSFPLPVMYRGRFYAIGYDTSDGSKLVYVSHRRHFRFVRIAELVRKALNVMDDDQMLPVENAEESESIEQETQEDNE